MSGEKAGRRHVAKQQEATAEPQHVPVAGRAEVTVAHFRSGPLPPAEEVAAYESTLPGAFDRILSMAEHQAEHRRRLETKVVDAVIRVEPRGQWLAFVIASLAILCGTLLVILDKSLEGLAAMFTALAVLVGVFVQQKRRRVQATGEISDPAAIGPGQLNTSPPVPR